MKEKNELQRLNEERAKLTKQKGEKLAKRNYTYDYKGKFYFVAFVFKMQNKDQYFKSIYFLKLSISS